MLNFCTQCGSESIQKRGIDVYANDVQKQRYKCNTCGANMYIPVDDDNEDIRNEMFPIMEDSGDYDVFVFTSAQNDTPIDIRFFDSLKRYSQERNALFKVIPTIYKNPTSQAQYMASDPIWPEALIPYMSDAQMNIGNHVVVVGKVRINATAKNPVSGMEGVCKGKSIIMGHPQLQTTTLPVNKHNHPIMLATTGSMSLRTNYSQTKAGATGEVNHTMSAVVIEVDRKEDIFFIRHLMADDNGGFYDLDKYYSPEGTRALTRATALVCGDEHVLFMDPAVKACTFENEDCLLNILKPEHIVRHDVVDCYTISHHHKGDNYLNYYKHLNDMNCLENELKLTCDHIVSTTPPGTKTIMVESNHHNHVNQYLNGAINDYDFKNKKLYHFLNWKMYDHLERTNMIGNAFKLFFEEHYPEKKDQFEWLEDDVHKELLGWTISMHGHIGPNGSRGTRKNLSKLPEKSIIGHSHSPGIEKLCYQMGTSSQLKQDWNHGPTSWMNTHAVLYPNSTVQMINIIHGRYRL